MLQTFDVFFCSPDGEQTLHPVICESEVELIRHVRLKLQAYPGFSARIEFMSQHILTLES